MKVPNEATPAVARAMTGRWFRRRGEMGNTGEVGEVGEMGAMRALGAMRENGALGSVRRIGRLGLPCLLGLATGVATAAVTAASLQAGVQAGAQTGVSSGVQVGAPMDLRPAVGPITSEGRRISLNFQDIEVRALLQLLADFSQFNIVSSDAVRGKITVRLRDIPWEQALDAILQAKGLAMVQRGPLIWVATRDELAARQRDELEDRMAIERLEPLVTRAFQLNYARAQDIVAQLTGLAHLQGLAQAQAGQPVGLSPGWAGGHPADDAWQTDADGPQQAQPPNARYGAGAAPVSQAGGLATRPRGAPGAARAAASRLPGALAGAGALGSAGRFLSPRGSAIAEPRTNQLFVTDVAARVEEVARMLARLDIAQRQVLIEARIVEASDTFGRSLGVKLGGGNVGVPPANGHRYLIGSNYDLIASGGLASGGAALNHPAFVNLPAAGLAGLGPAAAAITLFDSGKSRFISLELSALEAEGKGKLVSSPRLVTADKTRARIEQGTEFPYQTSDRDGRINTSFRRASLKLDVIPQITPDGNVILDVSVHKDSRGETTANGVAINTKQITTQVQVENGGTVVIGGIFEIAENEGEARVPLLGELPGIGALFRSRQRNTSKQELLIFLTPRVVEERTARASPSP